MYESLDREPARLREAFHWLTDAQVRAALAYYAAYPEEIDRRIAADEQWTPDELRARYPALVRSR